MTSNEQDRDKYYLLSKEIKDMINKVCKDIATRELTESSEIDYEYSLQFWNYMMNVIKNINQEYGEKLKEIEKQKVDLEHFLTKKNVDVSDKAEWLEELSKCIVLRRVCKDMYSLTNVYQGNVSRNIGFLLGMQDRQFTPRSIKYGDGTNHEDEETKTTVKIEALPQKRSKQHIIGTERNV